MQLSDVTEAADGLQACFGEGNEDRLTEQQGQLKQLKEGSKGNTITIEEIRTGQRQKC